MDQIPRPIAVAPPNSQILRATLREAVTRPARSSAAYEEHIAITTESSTRRRSYDPLSAALIECPAVSRSMIQSPKSASAERGGHEARSATVSVAEIGRFRQASWRHSSLRR